MRTSSASKLPPPSQTLEECSWAVRGCPPTFSPCDMSRQGAMTMYKMHHCCRMIRGTVGEYILRPCWALPTTVPIGKFSPRPRVPAKAGGGYYKYTSSWRPCVGSRCILNLCLAHLLNVTDPLWLPCLPPSAWLVACQRRLQQYLDTVP